MKKKISESCFYNYNFNIAVFNAHIIIYKIIRESEITVLIIEYRDEKEENRTWIFYISSVYI